MKRQRIVQIDEIRQLNPIEGEEVGAGGGIEEAEGVGRGGDVFGGGSEVEGRGGGEDWGGLGDGGKEKKGKEEEEQRSPSNGGIELVIAVFLHGRSSPATLGEQGMVLRRP